MAQIARQETYKDVFTTKEIDDLAKRFENVGACAIMPLAAPIGSGLGIQNSTNISFDCLQRSPSFLTSLLSISNFSPYLASNFF